MPQATGNLSDLPTWLWLAIVCYVLLVPLLWVIYRRWLAQLSVNLRAFTKEYAVWRLGARLSPDKARLIASTLTGSKIKAKELEGRSSSDRWQVTLSVGGNLAKASATYVPGHDALINPGGRPQSFQNAHGLPFDLRPPIRPLLDRKLWPQGDRFAEPSREDQARQDEARSSYEALYRKCFPKLQPSVAIAERSRLLFDVTSAPLSGHDAVPVPELSGFAAATAIAMLERKRRLFLDQPIDLARFYAPNLAGEVTITLRDLLNGASNLLPVGRADLSDIEGLARDPKKASDFNQVLSTAITGVTLGDEKKARKSAAKVPGAADLMLLSLILMQSFEGRHAHYLAMPQHVLFDPLSMANSSFGIIDNGLLNLWQGLRATPRDLLRLGLLYQREGTFGDQTLVDAKYIRALVTDRTGSHAGQTKFTRIGGSQDLLVAGDSSRNAIFIDPSSRKTIVLLGLGKNLPQKAVERFVSAAIAIPSIVA